MPNGVLKRLHLSTEKTSVKQQRLNSVMWERYQSCTLRKRRIFSWGGPGKTWLKRKNNRHEKSAKRGGKKKKSDGNPFNDPRSRKKLEGVDI